MMRRSVSAGFSMIELLQRLVQPQTPASGRPSFLSMRHRLLYAVNHSYPFSSNGYAVRTHGVASALVRAGLEVFAASRPGLPWDRAGFDRQGFAHSHVIDEVRYVHTRAPSEHEKPLAHYLTRSIDAFAELIRVFKPVAVMAASNWRNALPAAIAAHEAGLPFWYEVRGFWEISRISSEPEWVDSAGYKEAVEGETAVAQAAEHVFTINRSMREELIRRGVAADRIDLVPNGFQGGAVGPRGNDRVTRADLGIRSRYVVGYIGSFNRYEGLEDLIEAVGRLRRRGVDASLLLVGSSIKSGGMAIGDCPETAAYRALAERFDIGNHLVLPGRVSPGDTAAYYALIDVVVIPRRPFAVCEIVSPMKPLEAVSHGKRVLMSDVAPLVELKELCPNFSYFAKGNVESLTNELGELLTGGDFAPPRCEDLAGLTWDRNIVPMLAAIENASGASKNSVLAGRRLED